MYVQWWLICSISYAYDYRNPIDMAIEKCRVCPSAKNPYEFVWDMSNIEFMTSINYDLMIES